MKKEEYYLCLEKALEFVEANLDKPIPLSSISSYAFSSLSHFHRIFYFMTGYTLKDYIRRRRLSKAGVQLINSQKTVLDIALEAQFDSPESFNRSFKKMFQLSPSEFRKQRPEFPVMRKLEIHSNEGPSQPDNLSLNYVYLPEQFIMGVKTRTSLEESRQTQDIPNFFATVMQGNLLADIPGVIDSQKLFGIYSDMSDEEEFDYTVGLLVEKLADKSISFTGHCLPAAEYARFTFEGNPNDLEQAWRYIYGSWMPTSGRSRQKGLDFEIYYPDKTDIYIPMAPAS